MYPRFRFLVLSPDFYLYLIIIISYLSSSIIIFLKNSKNFAVVLLLYKSLIIHKIYKNHSVWLFYHIENMNLIQALSIFLFYLNFQLSIWGMRHAWKHYGITSGSVLRGNLEGPGKHVVFEIECYLASVIQTS